MTLLPAFLSQKAAISIVVAVLGVGAAVGAFASQDVLPGTTDDTVTTQTDDGVTDDGTVLEDETTDDTEGEVDGTETDGTTDDTTDGTTDETGGDTEETEGDTETDGTTDETDGDTEDTDGDADTEVEDDEEDVPREIVGIPDENPNFEPENGDETCDKGETVVKTTPSGKQVNVPCHSVEPGPPGFSNGQKGGDALTEDGDDAEDEEEEEEEAE